MMNKHFLKAIGVFPITIYMIGINFISIGFTARMLILVVIIGLSLVSLYYRDNTNIKKTDKQDLLALAAILFAMFIVIYKLIIK